MSENLKKWLILVFLSVVWGSSFILMKRGLEHFSPIQVGAIRVSIAAFTLLVIGFKHLKIINKQNILFLFLAGLLGNFAPAFLFAKAQSQLDSGITGILNSLVPLFTVIIGVYVFQIKVKLFQVIGIVIGLAGSLILILKGAEINSSSNYYYSLFVVVATVGYATNSNIIKKYLFKEKALSITVSAFSLFLIPSLFILYKSNFFVDYQYTHEQNLALAYISILAIIGTALSVVIFNQLIKISTPVFATSVTYLIPVIAVAWAIVDGEKLHYIQIIGTAIILTGVYMVNRK